MTVRCQPSWEEELLYDPPDPTKPLQILALLLFSYLLTRLSKGVQTHCVSVQQSVCLGMSGLPYCCKAPARNMADNSKELPAAGKTRGKQGFGEAFCQKAFQALKGEFRNNLIHSCQAKKYDWVSPQSQGELDFRAERWLPAC